MSIMKTHNANPTPGRLWFAQAESGFSIGAGDLEIATAFKRDDARRIVQCVNTHDEVVAALRGLLRTMCTTDYVDMEDYNDAIDARVSEAHAAIARAEEIEA